MVILHWFISTEKLLGKVEEKLLTKFQSFQSGRLITVKGVSHTNAAVSSSMIVSFFKNYPLSVSQSSSLKSTFRGFFSFLFLWRDLSERCFLCPRWVKALPGSSAQVKGVLSVLLLVFFAFAHGAVRSVWGESGGVAAGLQVVKQLVSCGKLVVTGHTAEVYFLLEVEMGDMTFNTARIEVPFLK